MKSVLISIQPKWCELICKCIGWDNQRPQYKKRLELRKTAPKPPFKAYIYCTKKFYKKGYGYFQGKYCGKVIGEFVCNYVLNHCEMSNADIAEKMSCVPREDILKYANGGNVLGWHIDNLVIYDKPKELSEFYRHDTTYDNSFGWAFEDRTKKTPITRPPQSWCYIEHMDEKGR